MTQFQFLTDWIQDAVIGGFVASLLFPLVGIFYPWWRNSLGWNLISFDAAIAVALLPAFLHKVFGLMPVGIEFLYIEAFALTAVPLIVLWRTVILWRAQVKGAVAERERIAHKKEGGGGHESSSAGC